jgi:Flp pilus assembly protein TadD
LELSGKHDGAAKAFAEFEQKSLAESGKADNSNHELVFYYADHAKQPLKALEVAQRELIRRQDVFTLDCYAWALYANGKYSEAQVQMQRALSVGIQDARLFRHAGEIALRAGDSQMARRYLRQAAELTGSEPTSAAQGVHGE